VVIDTSGGVINAEINGGTGSDHLNGGVGEDSIFDYKTAPATADGVKADDDNTSDYISGGGGADSLFGDGGNDEINAADGVQDTALNYGPGAGDVVTLDPNGLDPAPVYCETQHPGTGDTTAPHTTIPRVTSPSPVITVHARISAARSQSVGKQHGLILSGSCTGGCALVAKATVPVRRLAKVYRFKSSTVQVPDGATRKVKVSFGASTAAPPSRDGCRRSRSRLHGARCTSCGSA
jgi:hypothetical protein